jgi:hypothetical protein
VELVPFPVLPNSGTSVAKAISEREHLAQRWKRCPTQNQVFPRGGAAEGAVEMRGFCGAAEDTPFKARCTFFSDH